MDVKFRKVIIVGASGGSWVAMMMQFFTQELHVIDYDIVDASNLNRLPFEVGKLKVEELAKFIKCCHYYPYPCEASEEIFRVVNPDIVIDCTDNLKSQQNIERWANSVYAQYIKIGSNGTRSIFSASNHNVWDLDGDEENPCSRRVVQLPEVCMLEAGLLALMIRKGQLPTGKQLKVIEWEEIL